ncbi:MAG: hypothetical protein WDK96_02270 [Candidatus Paceibacterota bacterium]|jgi:hypothetical protein
MAKTRKEKVEVFWFIFTDHALTNDAIRRELPPEDTMLDVMCADGIPRDIWKCTGAFVTKMRKNRSSQGFSFTVFKKDGKYGSIKEAKFLNKKRKKVVKIKKKVK